MTAEAKSNATMKALMKAEAAPGIWLAEAPVPEIGPDEVLIQIHKTAICGTDIHIYKWDDWAAETIPVPMIVGHEYSGEIAAVGANVTRLKVGQRVSGEGHIVGQTSRNARAGKFHLVRGVAVIKTTAICGGGNAGRLNLGAVYCFEPRFRRHHGLDRHAGIRCQWRAGIRAGRQRFFNVARMCSAGIGCELDRGALFGTSREHHGKCGCAGQQNYFATHQISSGLPSVNLD